MLYSGKSLINNVFDASIPIKEQLLSVYTKELYAYQIGFNSYKGTIVILCWLKQRLCGT